MPRFEVQYKRTSRGWIHVEADSYEDAEKAFEFRQKHGDLPYVDDYIPDDEIEIWLILGPDERAKFNPPLEKEEERFDVGPLWKGGKKIEPSE